MCCRRGSRKKSQNPVCWYDRRTDRSKCKRNCAFTPFESNVHLKLRVLQKCNGAPFFLKYISPWAKRYFITLIRSQLCWCLELYSRSKSNRVQLFGLSNQRTLLSQWPSRQLEFLSSFFSTIFSVIPGILLSKHFQEKIRRKNWKMALCFLYYCGECGVTQNPPMCDQLV